MDAARSLLDELFGTNRNGESENVSIRFDDPRVCKSFLLGSCPNEVLSSTRMDLGECSKMHRVAMRADYENAKKFKEYYYELDALEQLEAFIADADRKTEQAKKRLAETQEELSVDVSVKADKVHELAEKIGESLAKAETLGAEGEVNESMKLMEEIDNLRKQKTEAETEFRSSIPAATYQQQKLRVCEVCCAYLGIHDNDRRLADHFGGKLHLGFIKIRETLKELQEKADEIRRKRREEYKRAKGRDDISDRDILRERERERERERRKEWERERERERKRSRERERERERSSRKSRRSHSKSPKKSRSRDRKKKSRSISRSRSRERKSHHSKY